jgi:hypothetical protein
VQTTIRIERKCCHSVVGRFPLPQNKLLASFSGQPRFDIPQMDEFIFKHLLHPMNWPDFQPIISVMPTWVSQPK